MWNTVQFIPWESLEIFDSEMVLDDCVEWRELKQVWCFLYLAVIESVQSKIFSEIKIWDLFEKELDCSLQYWR